MNRRGFLAGLPFAPIFAKEAAAKAGGMFAAAGPATLGNAVGYGDVGSCTSVERTPSRVITDFAEYLKTDDAAHLWSDAVRGAHERIDPDIAAHRSWSGFQKFRAQAFRNYSVAVERRRPWFERLVNRDGGWQTYD